MYVTQQYIKECDVIEKVVRLKLMNKKYKLTAKIKKLDVIYWSSRGMRVGSAGGGETAQRQAAPTGERPPIQWYPENPQT